LHTNTFHGFLYPLNHLTATNSLSKFKFSQNLYLQSPPTSQMKNQFLLQNPKHQFHQILKSRNKEKSIEAAIEDTHCHIKPILHHHLTLNDSSSYHLFSCHMDISIITSLKIYPKYIDVKHAMHFKNQMTKIANINMQ
jgi:hypothetical protein